MPKPTSRMSHLWAQGYERGSVYDRMSRAEQKAFREWLKTKAIDARVYESGLRGVKHRTKSPYAEV